MRLNPPRPFPARHLASLIPTIALVVMGGASCGRPKAPVAHIGATWIGQPEWAAYRKENPAGDLAGLVRKEVAFQLAEKRGLLNGIEWQDFLRVSRRAALSSAYLAGQPGHGNFSESMVRETYLASAETRHVSHVLCSSLAEAQAALKRATAGEAFEHVALEVSKDPSVKRNRGDLGWIKRKQMVAPFATEVFAAKSGALCGPFQTEFGWHVAKVHEVRVPDPAEFERSKASLLAAMQEALEAQKRPAALVPLKAEYRLVPDKAMLDLDRTTVPAPGDEGRQVGRVANQSVSLRELKLFMSENLKMSGASHGLGPETKEKFLDILADDYRLTAAAEKLGMHRRPEVQALVWMSQRKAAFDAFSKFYLGSYKVSESDLNSHYSANRDRFRSIGAVKLYLLVADRAETIDIAADEAMKGTPWNRLVDKHANKIATGQWDAGWLEVSSLQKLLPKDAINAMLKNPEGSLIGPVPGPDGYMLFRLLGRKPGEVMPFQDCREAVQVDFLKEHGASLVDRYLDSEGRKEVKVEEFPHNAVVALPK